MRVTGHVDGVPYDVEVTGDPAKPVVGSGRVAVVVQARMGRPVLLSPTGPARTVAGGDPASILAVLETETTVTSVADGANLLPPRKLRGVS